MDGTHQPLQPAAHNAARRRARAERGGVLRPFQIGDCVVLPQHAFTTYLNEKNVIFLSLGGRW